VREVGAENTYTNWIKTQGESYRSEGLKHLIEGVPCGEYSISPHEMGHVKTAKWRFAVSLVAHTENTESCIHTVERLPSEGRGKPALFIPIRFVLTNKLSLDDRLLLAFDALTLSGFIGRNIGLGKIIHGDDFATQKVKTSALASEVRKLTGKITSILSCPTAPGLVLNQHCPACEFQVRCRKIAIEKDDLSLLSGMSGKERKKLNSKGIFTVTQLSYTFRPRRRPRLHAAKREKYHHSLKALAIREKKIHVVGSSEPKIEGTPVYLDVEGLPDRDFHYLIGIRVKTLHGMIQHSFWADSTNDERQIWTNFLDVLSKIENPVLIHYGSYETAFLKLMCERYEGPSDGSVIAKALAEPLNILSFIFAHIYFPAFSNGLKDRARLLGFEWTEPNASGALTIVWRSEWEESRDLGMKEKLITYNAEDCDALRLVTEFISNLFLPAIKSTNQNVPLTVNVESYSKNSPFKLGRVQFQLAEFETINQAAYWDHQREKVLVRSSEHIKKVLGKAHKSRQNKLPVNKIILWPAPTSCNKCGSTNMHKYQRYSKTVLDVKFSDAGIKRWVIQYVFWRYRCKECWIVFQNHVRAWTQEKYGVNLRALTVYENIELRIPQERIAIFLHDLLGFNLARSAVNGLKASAAAFYKDTYDKLVEKITSGRLIHADETRVNLKAGIGYVWVFTNLENAVYVYSASREGELLHSLFKDFKGVLVSDFYAAYDSLSCPQQKCLIHLIRDMNDDLMKEPFNEEIKLLTGEFSLLLKAIIATVDSFGLKGRFLRKHKLSVDRFFKHLAHQKFQTEAAQKCKTRLEKNRHCLFTFLDFDGVPWNNNNAEHAIKSFALLRRDFNGVTTEKGLRDYLILLSIYETCKFKGVSFLDFLRSGEKDIDCFADKIAGVTRSIHDAACPAPTI
jgi:predicted RecB family nuclease